MHSDPESVVAVLRDGNRIIADYKGERRVMDAAMTRRRARYLLRLVERAEKDGMAVVNVWRAGLPGPLLLLPDATEYAVALEGAAQEVDPEAWPDLVLSLPDGTAALARIV